MSADVKSLGSFVWSIAEPLRGDFKQSEYGKVILPFVVLRRLDCILEASKQNVLDMAASLPDNMDDEARDTLLSRAVGHDMGVPPRTKQASRCGLVEYHCDLKACSAQFPLTIDTCEWKTKAIDLDRPTPKVCATYRCRAKYAEEARGSDGA